MNNNSFIKLAAQRIGGTLQQPRPVGGVIPTQGYNVPFRSPAGIKPVYPSKKPKPKPYVDYPSCGIIEDNDPGNVGGDASNINQQFYNKYINPYVQTLPEAERQRAINYYNREVKQRLPHWKEKKTDEEINTYIRKQIEKQRSKKLNPASPPNNNSSYIPEPPAGINYMGKISSLIKVAKQLNKKPDYKEYFNKCSLNKIACVKVALNLAQHNNNAKILDILRKDTLLKCAAYYFNIQKPFTKTAGPFDQSRIANEVSRPVIGLSPFADTTYDKGAIGDPVDVVQQRQKAIKQHEQEEAERNAPLVYEHLSEIPQSSAMHKYPQKVEDAVTEYYMNRSKPKKPEMTFSSGFQSIPRSARGIPLGKLIPQKMYAQTPYRTPNVERYNSDMAKYNKDLEAWNAGLDARRSLFKSPTNQQIAEAYARINAGKGTQEDRDLSALVNWRTRSKNLASNPALLAGIEQQEKEEPRPLDRAAYASLESDPLKQSIFKWRNWLRQREYDTVGDLIEKHPLNRLYNPSGKADEKTLKHLHNMGYTLFPKELGLPTNTGFVNYEIKPEDDEHYANVLGVTPVPINKPGEPLRYSFNYEDVLNKTGEDYVNDQRTQSWIPWWGGVLAGGTTAAAQYEAIRAPVGKVLGRIWNGRAAGGGAGGAGGGAAGGGAGGGGGTGAGTVDKGFPGLKHVAWYAGLPYTAGAAGAAGGGWWTDNWFSIPEINKAKAHFAIRKYYDDLVNEKLGKEDSAEEGTVLAPTVPASSSKTPATYTEPLVPNTPTVRAFRVPD